MHILPWRKILLPSALESICFTILAIGVIVSTNWRAIISELTGGTPLNDKAFQHSVGSQLSGISNNALVGHLTVILFWGFVGLAAYTVFWLGLNFVISLKNEVVVEADYVNKARFLDRVRVPLKQIMIGAILLGYAAVSAKVLFPLWIGLSHIFFHNIKIIDPQLILQLLGSFAGAWLTLAVGWTLAKLIFAVRD